MGHEDAVDPVCHQYHHTAEETQSLGWPICFLIFILAVFMAVQLICGDRLCFITAAVQYKAKAQGPKR